MAHGSEMPDFASAAQALVVAMGGDRGRVLPA